MPDMDVCYGERELGARFEVIAIRPDGLWQTFASCNDYDAAMSVRCERVQGRKLEVRDRWCEFLIRVREARGLNAPRPDALCFLAEALSKAGLVDSFIFKNDIGHEIPYLEINAKGRAFITESRKLKHIGRG